jgi:hypothetical protein
MIKRWTLLFILFGLLISPSCSLIEDVVENGQNDWPLEDIVMITPFVNAADISSINEAYSTHNNCPWGFEHRALDFMISHDHIPFQAVCNGVITGIEKFLNTGNGFWQVNVQLKYNETFSVNYAFEPFSSSESDGTIQLNNIQFAEGDHVQQGDIIGYLRYVNPGAHVDFHLSENGQSICPENFFTPAAVQQIYTILHQTFPGASMCYE